MGKTTGISWTDATWNPWQGCTKVSQGCKNCYMYREKKRYGHDPTKVGRSSNRTFNAPLKWNLPERSRIFVCSWSDFFHMDADEWRDEAMKIIISLPQYDFLIPTKRIDRVDDVIATRFIPDNVWLGVSVENQEMADKRIPILSNIPARIKWLSIEPMLEEIDLDESAGFPGYRSVDWVVFGGESGQNHRGCDPDWIRRGVKQCQIANVPVFVKQLGGWPDTRSKLEDLPEDLRIREFPNV